MMWTSRITMYKNLRPWHAFNINLNCGKFGHQKVFDKPRNSLSASEGMRDREIGEIVAFFAFFS